MRPLIRHLGIVIRSQSQIEHETQLARLASMRAAESHLDRRHQDGLVSTDTWKHVKDTLARQIVTVTDSIREIVREEPALENKEYETVRREVLRARRSALFDLHHDGAISQEVLEKLIAEVDADLQEENEPVSEDKKVEPSTKITPKEQDK